MEELSLSFPLCDFHTSIQSLLHSLSPPIPPPPTVLVDGFSPPSNPPFILPRVVKAKRGRRTSLNGHSKIMDNPISETSSRNVLLNDRGDGETEGGGEWEERRGGDTIKGVKWEVRMKKST